MLVSRCRSFCEIDIDGLNHNSILRAAVAAFTLSTGTKLNMQVLILMD